MAAQAVTSYHANSPPAVSPIWVLESWKQNLLATPSKFPPIKTAAVLTKHKSVDSKTSLSKKKSASSVFRGSLFSLVRIAPPGWAVDFDSKEQESLIKAHGGQILTLKLMDAMGVDAKNGGQRRQCFVVCWGGRPRLDLNPILSQLQRNDVCELVLVTPVWLRACIMVQKLVRLERMPLALMPQPWPLRKLESNLSISLTGFQGTEKAALIQLIKSIGGTFHNEMSSSNTHLICKEKASGLKLQKAIEWGLHIVSIDWVDHIVEHGYGGKEKAKGGCEVRFSARE
jgi:hypothetical protein